MNKRNINLEDAINFVTDGNISELSELSSDESEDDELVDINFALPSNQDSSTDEEDDIDDNVPLSSLVNNTNVDNAPDTTPNASDTTPNVPAPDATSNKGHIFRWRKKDTLVGQHSFVKSFSDPPLEELTPFTYFQKFITPKLIDDVAEQTNLYSFQKDHKIVDTNASEVMSLIGICIKMGIVSLPSIANYWSRELRYPAIADVMPRNRFQQLLKYLHFVDNNTIDKSDKLAKVNKAYN